MIGDNKDEKILFKIKIFVLIIEAIFVGLIAFIFFGVSKVKAQGMNMTSWNYRNANDQWTTYQNGTTQALVSANAIGFNFDGTTGNNNGVVYLEADVIGSITTGDVSVQWWTSPTNNGTGTVSKNCIVTNSNLLTNHLKCQFNFTITNNSNDIKIITNFANARSMNNVIVSGYTDVQPTNNATTQDIINQTIQITNQIMQSVQDSIANVEDRTGDIIYTIENAISDATNTIIGNNQFCSSWSKQDIVIDGKFLMGGGQIGTNSNYGISGYIKVENATINLETTYTTQDGTAVCYYNREKTLISCEILYNISTLTIPEYTQYIRMTFNKQRNAPKFTICTNRLQAIIDNQDENTDKIINADDERYQAYLQFLEDTNTSRWTEEDEIQEEQNGLLQSILSSIGNLFSSSVDDPTNSINSFSNSLASDTPISNLILLPVSLYQSVINNINGTCNSINLGQLWGSDLVMTCVSIPDIIGSSLYGVIDILISGFFILAIRKKFIEIFENLSSLHTRRNELE